MAASGTALLSEEGRGSKEKVTGQVVGRGSVALHVPKSREQLHCMNWPCSLRQATPSEPLFPSVSLIPQIIHFT